MSSPRLITALFPDLTWYQSEFQADLALLISEQGILQVGSSVEIQDELERRKELGQYITYRRLPGKAIIPGLVNTHSHAFQRAIRGRTEFPVLNPETDQDFWSWREVMYHTALSLSPEDVEAVAQAVFVEMVKAGITRVGEFHYLHHKNNGELFEQADELCSRVLSGARSAGIGVTMLRSYYQRAGVGRPKPEGAQLRFCDPNVDFYLESLERLQQTGIDIAVTPHSVRAVSRADLERLVEYAKKKCLPFHIHVSEQAKEIDECVAEYGCRPVELLEQLGALSAQSTLVHAIHLSAEEVRSIGTAQCSIASCPTTERNLGDGIVPALALREAGAFFTFGTDSQCQIAPFEDARQLEYHLRLRDQKRSLLFRDAKSAGVQYMDMLTVNGARSLGAQESGIITEGAQADLVAVDLEHLSLAGCDQHSLALDLIFSATSDVVSDVWVKAAAVVTDRQHRSENQAKKNLARIMTRLRG